MHNIYIGLTTIQARKVLRNCQQPSTAAVTTNSTPSSSLLPSALTIDYGQSSWLQSQETPKAKSFQIRYVLCFEIFICNQEEHCLSIDPNNPMEFLIRQICNIHKLSDLLTLELFSRDGCPLNVNSYTMKCKCFSISQFSYSHLPLA